MKTHFFRKLGFTLFLALFIFLLVYGIILGDMDFARMESSTL